MNSFRPEPEPHVAQQSRRDKLRVQHIDPIPDLVQVRDIYDPALFSSSAHIHNLPLAGAETSITNPSPSSFHETSGHLARAGDPRGLCVWRAQQPSWDWIVTSPAPMTNSLASPGAFHFKPGFSAYPDASTALSSQENHEQQCGDLHLPSSQFHHPTLQEEVVTSVGDHGLELPSVREPGQPCSWVDSGNELLLLPNFGEQPNTVWVSRQPPQWNGEGGFARGKVEEGFTAVGSERGAQGLSLTLSSNPASELHMAQLEERFGLPSSRATTGTGQSCPYPRFSIGDRGYGGLFQGIFSSPVADTRRAAGPLGPFTGYATILKSSKFLKPAQQLLDEFCSAVKQCHVGGRSCGVSSSANCDDVVAGEKEENGARGGSSAVSSSTFHSSSTEAGVSGEFCQIHRPEMQQKKAKLLYMLEEVCRRYKQYHQQMQMVVSAFDSVAGLSSATPYTSLALKAVSKHFRCIKNAISDQLRHISKVLGEEFIKSPSSSRGETTVTPKLKYVDQSLRKQKAGAGENGLGFVDQNQPVWRPQRGLPERAVAVLRAWLFDHFLHPYPTDTDKHMLATQTGLSRNQVSNWFINARVRLWKPMVEEIHVLETEGMNLNSGNRNDGTKPPVADAERPSNGRRAEAQCNKPLNCSSMVPVLNDEGTQSMEPWHCEKRSRTDECGIPASMDGNLISFGTYHGAMDVGGLGAVSLTLGLRHEDGRQQQQMGHFGSQMLHDFVG
ncbi:BEL1-like homeodomain protein 8 [Cocos nucifera]|uniref:BEL1-like homeodomain protein 8 n=1 Tax=Cocos nucifera TaxID=13894 RepID=A0A8K0N7J3_COCNU|nr:BEL1-like homeodomain protein 8 [Cocos nucifera]